MGVERHTVERCGSEEGGGDPTRLKQQTPRTFGRISELPVRLATWADTRVEMQLTTTKCSGSAGPLESASVVWIKERQNNKGKTKGQLTKKKRREKKERERRE